MHERKRKLRLRFAIEVFDEIATALELATDADRARFLDVPEPTYHRVSRGLNKPSNEFMAAVMDAMDRLAAEGAKVPDFRELFPKEEAAAALPEEDLSPVMTRPEAARFLRVGLTKLDALYKSGQLKHVRIGGAVLIRRSDAVAYVDQLPVGRQLQPA